MGQIAGKSDNPLAHLYVTTINLTPADTVSLEILVRVGTVNIDARISAAVAGNFDISVFEAPTVSAPGASEPIRDIKRPRALEPPLTTIFSAPTTSADGLLLIGPVFVPGGTSQGNNAVGAAFASEGHAELTASTDYLIRFTNISGGAARITAAIDFIELPS